MAFNFYDTHTLLASVQQLPPLHSFLLDRYFPTNAASDVFATDDVLVEYRKGSKKAAPFVAPRKGGITILREGYTMKRFTPAHIAPKRPLSIDDLKKRGFGEALYTNLTPAQRQAKIYKRGTVLALSAGTAGDGLRVILGTTAKSNETLTANCVLADDVEVGTTSDAVATAYRTGHFNENSLITDNSHAISETDKEALRSAGILLSDAVAY